MDTASSERQPRRVRIDCQEGMVELLDHSAAPLLRAKFPKALEQSGPFKLVFAIAIAQRHKSAPGQSTDWPGVDQDLFERLIRDPLTRSFDVAAGTTYWSQLGSMSQPFVAFTPDTAAADLGRQVFQLIRKSGPFPKLRFLGDRLPVGGGRFRYSEVHIDGGAGEPWSGLRGAIEEYVRRYRPCEFSTVEPVGEADARLKELLLKDAWDGLNRCLHNRGLADYRPLQLHKTNTDKWALSRLRIQDDDDSSRPDRRSTDDNRGRLAVANLGATEPVSVESLFSPEKHDVIRAPTGTGKTTFLRWLQLKINERTNRRALFLRADRIPSIKPLRWSALADQLWGTLDVLGDNVDLLDYLRILRDQGKLVLLINALDNPGKEGCSGPVLFDALRPLLRIQESCRAPSLANAVIATSRLTGLEGFRGCDDIATLELQPFDRDALEVYCANRLVEAEELVRWDRSLLQTPMLSHVVRSLLETDDGYPNAVQASSLWELYEAFVDHAFNMHLQERLPTCDLNWADRVQRYLAELSYWALDRATPAQVVISLASADASATSTNAGTMESRQPTLRSHDLVLKDIAGAGMVELLTVSGHGRDKAICFAHQSFQEFFAAVWIHDKERLVQHVLEEYWSPKWREVIRFLAGCESLRVVERLYSGPSDDDALCTRLLSAAHSAGGGKCDPAIDARLAGALSKAVRNGHGYFGVRDRDGECLAALASVGASCCLEQCWGLTVDAGRGPRKMWPIPDGASLRRMYSWERFEQLAMSMGEAYQNTRDKSPRVDRFEILTAWIECISRDMLMKAARMLARIPSEATRWECPEMPFIKIAPRLDRREVKELVELLIERPSVALAVVLAAKRAASDAHWRAMCERCVRPYVREPNRRSWDRSASELVMAYRNGGCGVSHVEWERWALDIVGKLDILDEQEIAAVREVLAGAESRWIEKYRSELNSSELRGQVLALKVFCYWPEHIHEDVGRRASQLVRSPFVGPWAVRVLALGGEECEEYARQLVEWAMKGCAHESTPWLNGYVLDVVVEESERLWAVVGPEWVTRVTTSLDEGCTSLVARLCGGLFRVMTRREREVVIERMVRCVSSSQCDTDHTLVSCVR